MKASQKNSLVSTILLYLSLLSFHHISHAWDLELGIGQTGQKETVFRTALNKPWEQKYFDSSIGYLSGYWSAAYTRWNRGEYGNNVHTISASPVITYNFYTPHQFKPFIEAGIGISLFSKTKVGSRNIGSAFHFEDRLGIGVRFGNHTIGLRAIHYSNAGLKRPNNGIESYSLYYSHKF